MQQLSPIAQERMLAFQILTDLVCKLAPLVDKELEGMVNYAPVKLDRTMDPFALVGKLLDLAKQGVFDAPPPNFCSRCGGTDPICFTCFKSVENSAIIEMVAIEPKKGRLKHTDDSLLHILSTYKQVTGSLPVYCYHDGQSWSETDCELMVQHGIQVPRPAFFKKHFGAYYRAYLALTMLGYNYEEVVEELSQKYRLFQAWIKSNPNFEVTANRYYAKDLSDDQLLDWLYEIKIIAGEYPTSTGANWAPRFLGVAKNMKVPTPGVYVKRFGSFGRAVDLAEERAQKLINEEYGDNVCGLDSLYQELLEQENQPPQEI
jgi:hypothetical protein